MAVCVELYVTIPFSWVIEHVSDNNKIQSLQSPIDHVTASHTERPWIASVLVIIHYQEDVYHITSD